MRAILHVALAVLVASCKTAPSAEDASDGKADLAQRKLIGAPAPYAPHAIESFAALHGSFLERRALGWSVLQKIVTPVALGGEGVGARRVPAFLTWYELTELRRIMKDAEERARDGSGVPWEEAVRAALASYPEQRAHDSATYRALLGRLGDPDGDPRDAARVAAGLGRGRGRNLYSGEIARDLLASASRILRCRDELPPLTGDDVEAAEIARLSAEPRDVGRFADCLEKDMVRGSVVIKAKWQEVRCDSDETTLELPAHATDGDALGAVLRDGTWGDGEPTRARCGDLYTVRVPRSQGRGHSDFALMGLHVTTKEVPEWVWVSLWWAPDATRDFGADRPTTCPGGDCEAWRRWQGYKMCVVTAFDETDPVALGTAPLPEGLAAGDRAVLEATRAAHAALGDRQTWCSNPYIERNVGEANSSCIGCHQHAGPGITFDEASGRHNRREKRVNRFLGDFLWTFRDVADTMAVVRDEVSGP